MDDLMSIGEFSERSGLSAKRLRSYAVEGLLVPAAVDPASGYRYYAPTQLREARVIDALRQADMPLADIRAVLHQSWDGRLEAWERQLETQVEERRKALARAHGLLMETRPEPAPERQANRETAMTKLMTAGRSETGPVRDRNEDAVLASDRLAVIADGMGGSPGGEIAAHAAVGVVGAVFTGRSLDELGAAVRAANWAIWDRARNEAALSGMGTTLCAAGLLDDGRVGLANVGDSRAYQWRDGTLVQLTVDHTFTAELIRRGELSERDARRHPHFGVLTRAVGVAPEVAIDTVGVAMARGDRLIVCSDGLTNELAATDIADALTATDSLAAVADRLVELALARGGRDNVSVVVVEMAA